MAIFQSIIPSLTMALSGCAFFGAPWCATPPPSVPSAHVFMATYATSSSPKVQVVTDINGKKNTSVVNAPYGVETHVTVTQKSGQAPDVRASTTPLTPAQREKMLTQEKQMERQIQEQITQMRQEMNQMFAEQEKLFQ